MKKRKPDWAERVARKLVRRRRNSLGLTVGGILMWGMADEGAWATLVRGIASALRKVGKK